MFFYYRSYLTPKEQSAFDILAVAATQLKAKVTLTGINSIHQVNRILYAIKRDIPELSFMTPGSQLVLRPDSVDVQLRYKYTRKKVLEYLKRMNRIADYLVAFNAGKSDYEVLMSFHDFLIKHSKYHLPENENECEVFGPEGALLSRHCVCAGYAYAFKLLCDRCGIECIYVSGFAISESNSYGRHGWNMVKLDGKWYHIDITFEQMICENYISKGYFLLSTSEILHNHKFLDSSFPIPDSTESANPLKRLSQLEDVVQDIVSTILYGKNIIEFRLNKPMNSGELNSRVMELLSRVPSLNGYTITIIMNSAKEVTTFAISISG